MEHSEARQLLSARMDGELSPERSPALGAHLEGCADCRAFVAGAERLRALTVEMPRLEAPVSRWAPPVRARRWSARLAPGLAAAVVVAMLLTLFGPPGTFSPRFAAAAERLTTIRTLFVERVITDITGTTYEKIWFEAPDYLRIERTTPSGTTLEIDRPGVSYTADPSGAALHTGVPPAADILPEPLSPTVAVLGDLQGSGPTVDGVPTLRYDLDFGDGMSRIAYVAASSYITLGTEESLILQKIAPEDGAGTRKRVTAFEINRAIDMSVFSIPRIAAVDDGFRRGGVSSFPLPPVAVPAGFTLVSSGSSPLGSVALFARGSLPLEIDESLVGPAGGPTSRSIHVSIGRTNATIIDDLYALPRITFDLSGTSITIVAPLDQAGLVSAASTMFALGRE
ncbi:MAG TPA: zf-HC2 domain-containing protein [Actinomycetota bacterium]|nr:zf-HC2 domain-containing protein [Actinomycetota bacterium]